MKTSVSLFLSDILPQKRKLYHQIVKNDILDRATVDDDLKRLKDAGLEGIEICLPQYTRTTEEDIKQVMQLSKRHKLPIFSIHQSLRFFSSTKLPEISELMDIANRMSASLVVLHMNTAQKQIFDFNYIKALHQLEKQYGITVTFENMEKYIASLRKKYIWEAQAFAKVIDDNNFHITLDVVHLAHSGGDILTFYEQNKDRIKNIHLSDYRYNMFNSNLRPLRFKHMPLGEGELPIQTFLKLLKKEHYKGLLTMEIHTDLKGICESIAIINQAK
ncbi:MAG: sugar phosphate isomerase/epimerase family protein [Candidatus Levyibacteriota bacterium]